MAADHRLQVQQVVSATVSSKVDTDLSPKVDIKIIRQVSYDYACKALSPTVSSLVSALTPTLNKEPDAMDTITADHIIAEFAALGIAAYWDYPGYVSAADATGRILCIGQANGSWGVDVYASEADAVLGVPATSEELPEANVRLLVNHALVVANRVAVGQS